MTDSSVCSVCHPSVRAEYCLKCVRPPERGPWNFPRFNPPQAAAWKIFQEDPFANVLAATGTGTGKTAIAEMALYRRFEINGEKSKFLVLMPLKALANEKVVSWVEKFPKKNVILLTSDSDIEVADRNDEMMAADIIVASYEILGSIVRNPAKYSVIDNIDCLIVDEVHELADISRGGVLDGALTRFFIYKKTAGQTVQFVGLSATFDNIDHLAEYIRLHVGDVHIINDPFSPIKTTILRDGTPRYYPPRGRVGAVLDDLQESGWMEQPGQTLVMVLSIPDVMAIAEELNRTYGEGVAATHFSEMSREERDAVEDAYLDRQHRVLVSTPTLCLSSDTPISHSGGSEMISQLDDDSHIYTLNKGKVEQIMDFTVMEQSNIPSNLINIRSAHANVKLTHNHIIPIKRNGKQMNVPAIECQKGDRIAIVKKFPHPHPEVPSWSTFGAFFEEDGELDKDDFYFIGLMMGDGHGGRLPKKTSPTFTATKRKKGDLLEFIKEYSQRKKFFRRVNTDQNGVTQIVFTASKSFISMLHQIGVTKGTTRTIHPSLIKAPNELLKKLLMGYFDTDGWVCSRHQKVGNAEFYRIEVGITTISKNLSDVIIYSLRRFGISATVSHRQGGKIVNIHPKRDYSSKPSYHISISRFDDIALFEKEIGFRQVTKAKKLKEYMKQHRKNKTRLPTNVSCGKCQYGIDPYLFGPGRHEASTKRREKFKEIISYLGEHGPTVVTKIKQDLGYNPNFRENRLNKHYQLIDRTRISGKPTNYLWELNPLGQYVYKNIDKMPTLFLNDQCPICGEKTSKNRWGKPNSKYHDDLIYWEPMTSIMIVQNSKPVYDVLIPDHVTDTHLFDAGGMLVHNSAGVNLPCRNIIMDISFFDDFKMNILPIQKINQIKGRAGRIPYWKEGYISYICEDSLKDKATDELAKANIVHGTLLDSAETVLNVEVNLGQNRKEALATWYQSTFSRFSSEATDEQVAERFQEALDFIGRGFIRVDGDRLEGTTLGKITMRSHLDPRFVVHALAHIREVAAETDGQIRDRDVVQLITGLFTSRVSDVTMPPRKVEAIKGMVTAMDHVIDAAGEIGWSSKQRSYSWMRDIQDNMGRLEPVVNVAIGNQAAKTLYRLATVSAQKGFLPVALAQLSMALTSSGIRGVGLKRLLFLHGNGVTVGRVLSRSVPDGDWGLPAVMDMGTGAFSEAAPEEAFRRFDRNPSELRYIIPEKMVADIQARLGGR